MTEKNDAYAFLSSISFPKEEEETIQKYLALKGIENYFSVLRKYIELTGIAIPTWIQVSDFYRFDKRLCYLLSRYFSTIEELLRAILVRDIGKLDKYQLLKEKVSALFSPNTTLPNKFYIELGKHPNMNFPEFIKLRHFIALLDMVINDSYINSEDKNFVLEIKQNEKALNELRNAVFHSKFLFSETYDGNDLPKILAIFQNSLPTGFLEGDHEHLGFKEELNSCGRGLQEGLLPIANYSSDYCFVKYYSTVRSVTMFNVGFGDCFLIRNKDSSLIVDCGTMNQRFPFDNLLSTNIQNLIPGVPDLLITHFHKDHFGMVQSVSGGCPAKRYENVYIRGLLPGQFSFWAKNYMAGLLALFVKTRDKKEFSSLMNIPGTLAGICQPNGIVKTLNKGGVFQIGNTSCNVLWPDLNSRLISNFIGQHQEEIDGFLEGLILEVNSDSRDILKKDIEFYQSDDEESSLRGLFEPSEKGKKLDEYANIDSQELCRQRIEQINSILQNNSEAINFINQHFHKVEKLYSDFENLLSIVFDSNDGLLFTGDITPECLRICLENHHSIYKIIKVPHHGTRPHFFDFDSFSKKDTIFLIPNSKDYSNWYIDSRYLPEGRICQCLNSIPSKRCPLSAKCKKNLTDEFAAAVLAYRTYKY